MKKINLKSILKKTFKNKKTKKNKKTVKRKKAIFLKKNVIKKEKKINLKRKIKKQASKESKLTDNISNKQNNFKTTKSLEQKPLTHFITAHT